jgi:hypothetical protein
MKPSVSNPLESTSSKLDSYTKGRLFEEYIISLFNKKHFQIDEWRRSEPLADLSKLINYGYPDLEMIFKGVKSYKFAVECKWQCEFKEGKIEWASMKKIARYQEFENKMRIPVFVAIGIGGKPSEPDKLFVTPLCNISGLIELSESDMIPYKRKTARRFFYDTVQLRLW